MNPLFVSRAGRLLYRELPEVHRLYDTRNPDQGRLGDLEAFLFGFGHLLDRFDATLRQFHADGLLDPIGPAGDEKGIQGWLLPYVAQLFGVELVAPDPDSRRRELAASIWVARRRGTRIAVDTAAEMIVGQAVIVVPGAARVLRTPSLDRPPMTHREITGLSHPADAAILQEATLPPFVIGFSATRPGAHDGLRVGTPDVRLAMRAVRGGIERPEAEVRPPNGVGPVTELVPFTVQKRRGQTCFPRSYEDRVMRTPDIRAPQLRRPRLTHISRPDAVTLHIRPPQGMFTGAETRLSQPTIATGEVVLDDVPEGGSLSDIFYEDASAVIDLNSSNEGPGGRHLIEDLKFAGTIRVMRDRNVEFRNCAIGAVTGPAVAGGDTCTVVARNCLFGHFELTNHPEATAVATLEYCTVMGACFMNKALVSDSIVVGPFTAAGDGTGTQVGCVRYSAIPEGFDPAHVHRFEVFEGTPQFLVRPCVERGGTMLHDELPEFGEPCCGVLSDRTAPGIAGGAEDGGEMGVYHNDWHLARLKAAVTKAGQYLPVGQRVFGHYDTRLLAALPAFGA